MVITDFSFLFAQVEIRQYNLELWPGYTTSIRQHENQLLLNAEITHKVLRTDTVARFLQDCIRRDGRDWQVSIFLLNAVSLPSSQTLQQIF